MIYWLCLFFCSMLKTNFAYPSIHNMPEENPLYYDQNGDEKYEDSIDPRFDPDWYPWNSNPQPEFFPSERNFPNHRMNSDYNENTEADILDLNKRNFKFPSKRKRPSNILKSHVNYQNKKHQEKENDDGYQNKKHPEKENDDDYQNKKHPEKENDDDYQNKKNQEKENEDDYQNDELEEDTQKGRNIINSQISPTVMIRTENILDVNNINRGYENEPSVGYQNNVYLPENPEINNPSLAKNNFQKNNNYNLENRKENYDVLKTGYDTRQQAADNNFYANENRNSMDNRHSMPTFRTVYVSEEAENDGQESFTNINNRNEGIETKVDKRDDMSDTHVQNDNEYFDENTESDETYTDESKVKHMDPSSKKRDDSLLQRDAILEYGQKLSSSSNKRDKTSRGLNKTVGSIAAPKLTLYHDNQSTSESHDKSADDSTTEVTSHMSERRMISDKPKVNIHRFHKSHKTNNERNPMTTLKENLRDDNDFNERTNHKPASETTESLKKSSGTENKTLINHQIKGQLKKKTINSEKYRDDFERDLPHESTNKTKDDNFKPKKSAEYRFYNDFDVSKDDVRRSKFEGNASETYQSKKRSIGMRDVGTEGGNVIHFEKNIENQDETPVSLQMNENKPPPKINVRHSNKIGMRNRDNEYNMEDFPPQQPPRKSFPHQNKYNQDRNSEFGFNGKSQKREPEHEHIRPSGLEIKPLSEPNNFEINISRQFDKKRGKVDEKLLRTMEDHKIKKTILKDGKTHKETDIVENANEKVIDNVHMISDPNPKTSIPLVEPVNIPVQPLIPIIPLEDQGEIDQEENSDEQVVEPDFDDLKAPFDEQIDSPSDSEAEEFEQNEPQIGTNEDYGEETNEKVAPDDDYNNVEAEQANDVPESLNVQNIVNPNQLTPDAESEPSEMNQENYDENYRDYSQESAELSSTEEVDNYPPLSDLPQRFQSKAPPRKIPKYPTPKIKFQNNKKNGISGQKYKQLKGKGKKHKKIYNFSTEYAVSDGVDEFEKEEKLEKASKTVVRNKLTTANESLHHFQEKKTEIKNNKESYHEAFIEEKDESKFPRNMDKYKYNPQRAIVSSKRENQPNSETTQNNNSNLDYIYPRSSSDDSNLTANEYQDYEDDPRKEHSDRNSKRFSPSDELQQHEELIDDIKTNQSRLKNIRDSNANFGTNETQVQENIHSKKRDGSLYEESNQEFYQQNPESKGMFGEMRDLNNEGRESSMLKRTAPHSESRSGNVVYITMRTTTVDLVKQYHDFIQIEDGKRNSGRYERHPKHYIRKRRKNQSTRNR